MTERGLQGCAESEPAHDSEKEKQDDPEFRKAAHGLGINEPTIGSLEPGRKLAVSVALQSADLGAVVEHSGQHAEEQDGERGEDGDEEGHRTSLSGSSPPQT